MTGMTTVTVVITGSAGTADRSIVAGSIRPYSKTKRARPTASRVRADATVVTLK